MTRSANQYHKMEQIMTAVLLFQTAVFILYLFASGFGIIWLKILTAIIAIIISCLCLAFLYFTREYKKSRSLWMTTASLCLLVCLLFSLILGYPSP